MLTIYDDTYSLRAKDYSLEYLKEDKYRTLVNIIDEVIGARIKEETKKMQSSKLIACHKTIKFKTNDSLEYLSRELNAKIFENFEKLIREFNKPYVSFSGQITQTTILSENYIFMNKRDFYLNVKSLLDYYIELNILEPKILKYGINFKGYELLSIQNNIFYILDKDANNTFIAELLDKNNQLQQQLTRYNLIAKIREDNNSFISFINQKYSSITELKGLLNKITKSFLNYGRNIYNI